MDGFERTVIKTKIFLMIASEQLDSRKSGFHKIISKRSVKTLELFVNQNIFPKLNEKCCPLYSFESNLWISSIE